MNRSVNTWVKKWRNETPSLWKPCPLLMSTVNESLSEHVGEVMNETPSLWTPCPLLSTNTPHRFWDTQQRCWLSLPKCPWHDVQSAHMESGQTSSSLPHVTRGRSRRDTVWSARVNDNEALAHYFLKLHSSLKTYLLSTHPTSAGGSWVLRALVDKALGQKWWAALRNKQG